MITRQPALEITTARYRSATDARNALVLLSRTGTSVQPTAIGGGTGLCFQVAFYPKDAGRDWSCGFTSGTTLVQVKTVVTNPAFNAIQVAKAIAPKF